MKRRDFLRLLPGAALVQPLAARAQQRPAMPVVGWLSSRTPATDALVLPAFHRALNARGFVEGRNVTIEYCHVLAAVGTRNSLPTLEALHKLYQPVKGKGKVKGKPGDQAIARAATLAINRINKR